MGGAHCPVGPACVSPHIQNRPHPSTTCAPRPLPLPAWHSFSATHCARADARGVFVVGGTTKGDWGGCGVTGEGVGRGGCGVVCARHSVVCRRGVEPSRLPVRHRRLHMGGVAVHGHPSPPHRPRRHGKNARQPARKGTHTYMRTHIRTHTKTYTHIHTYACTCTRTHEHARAHTHRNQYTGRPPPSLSSPPSISPPSSSHSIVPYPPQHPMHTGC